MSRLIRLLTGVAMLWVTPSHGASIKVAVASNFQSTAQSLARLFAQQSGHQVIISSASSGKLYAQILHGAPFDVFLSADSHRPELLQQHGRMVEGSRLTYAIGQLVLWVPDTGLSFSHSTDLLSESYRHIAMANPKTAPFGMAAQQSLMAMGLWHKLQGKLVLGENVSQAMQFAQSGHAQASFVALSMMLATNVSPQRYRLIEQGNYATIEQQMVLLKENQAAKRFWQFLQSSHARAVIQTEGYGLP